MLTLKQIREFTGTYDDWYIASTVLAKQNEKDVNRKLKKKMNLKNSLLDLVQMLQKQNKQLLDKNNLIS